MNPAAGTVVGDLERAVRECGEAIPARAPDVRRPHREARCLPFRWIRDAEVQHGLAGRPHHITQLRQQRWRPCARREQRQVGTEFAAVFRLHPDHARAVLQELGECAVFEDFHALAPGLLRQPCNNLSALRPATSRIEVAVGIVLRRPRREAGGKRAGVQLLQLFALCGEQLEALELETARLHRRAGQDEKAVVVKQRLA